MNREKPERRRQLSHWRKHRERGRGTRELWTLLITLYFALRIWEVPGEEEGERERVRRRRSQRRDKFAKARC